PDIYTLSLHDALPIWQVARAREPGRRDGLNLAVLQRAFHRGVEIDHQLDVVAQQGDDDLGRAAIRNDLEIEPGRGLEQLGAEILRAADIDRPDVELSRLRARLFDE